MSQSIINGYKNMWIFCCFDLPTKEKREQKRASNFRKLLLEEGFKMFQYSIYIRHCINKDTVNTHINHLKTKVPIKGKVSFFIITDKQYGDCLNFWGEIKEKPPKRQDN